MVILEKFKFQNILKFQIIYVYMHVCVCVYTKKLITTLPSLFYKWGN